MSTTNWACCSIINSIRRSNCWSFMEVSRRQSYHVSFYDSSQYILRAQSNDCCNDQPKEHQDQHEWIEKNVAPGVQKVDVPTQIRWYLFCRRHVGGRG